MSSFSRSRSSEELVFEQEDVDIHVEQAIAKEFGRSKSRRGLGDRSGRIRMLTILGASRKNSLGNAGPSTPARLIHAFLETVTAVCGSNSRSSPNKTIAANCSSTVSSAQIVAPNFDAERDSIRTTLLASVPKATTTYGLKPIGCGADRESEFTERAAADLAEKVSSRGAR
jgi:hypothetical protein